MPSQGLSSLQPGYYAMSMAELEGSAKKELLVIKRPLEPSLAFLSIRQSYNVVGSMGVKLSWGGYYKHAAGAKATNPILREATPKERLFLVKNRANMAQGPTALLISAGSLLRAFESLGIAGALPSLREALRDLLAGRAELRPLEVGRALAECSCAHMMCVHMMCVHMMCVHMPT